MVRMLHSNPEDIRLAVAYSDEGVNRGYIPDTPDARELSYFISLGLLRAIRELRDE